MDAIEEAVARTINPAPWAEWGYALPDRGAQRTSARATARVAIRAYHAALEADGYMIVRKEGSRKWTRLRKPSRGRY